MITATPALTQVMAVPGFPPRRPRPGERLRCARRRPSRPCPTPVPAFVPPPRRDPHLLTHAPPMTDERLDLAVVGAGIAGASVAYFAASAGAGVLLLERESHPGMHSTGRSAAMFMESYGSPQVRALTRASRAFLMQPPAGFTATPLLRPRGALYVGHAGQHDDLQALFDALRSEGCPCEWLDADQARARVPVLLPEAAAFAVFDPLAADLDVHALHQGFLRGARAHGATLHCDADVVSLERDHEGWELVDATGRRWRARRVVNAAGAWADEFAIRARVAPLGVQPRRRSAFVFDPPPG